MENKTGNRLETDSVSRLMCRYAIPCIISLVVAALYNIVDQLFIANADYLGSQGNAANTVVFPLTVVALAIAVCIGDGACAFVSIALGSSRKEDAHRCVGNAIVLVSIAGFILMAIYLIFMNQILTNIRTIVTLNVILSITGSISAFEPPYVITGGANGTGTFFVLMNTIAHTNQKVGLASAMAVFLLVVIIICYILQQLFFKFVFRKAEDEGNGYMSRKAMKNLKKEARRNG